jgi:ABC-type uncharacterized transport system involved in gliding motility auxiliary subunit
LKNFLRGTNTLVLSLAVVGIFIVLTLFLNSVDGLQWDWTKNKQFTLSEQTRTTLSNLNSPINVTLFVVSDDQLAEQAKGLLREYEKKTKQITLTIINPEKKPSLATQYEISRFGTAYFEQGEKRERVDLQDIVGQGESETSYEFRGEQKFTQAILNLTSENRSTLYFVAGHNELPTERLSMFRESLSDEGYAVNDVNLVREGKIPADATALFFLGPLDDLSEAEYKLLADYLKGAGKLFLGIGFADKLDAWNNWNKLLGTYGIRNQKAVVMELQQSLSSDPLAIVPLYESHPITEKLQASDYATVMPGVLALTAADNNTAWVTRPLLKTSENAYGKTDLSLFKRSNVTMTDIQKTDADLAGPLDIAYAVESADGKGKAIIVGNSLFLSNDFFGELGNRDFALNSVGWLAENKNAVTIRPRVESMQQATILPGQAMWIFYGSVIGLPLVLLLVGVIIWLRRRKG